MRRFVVPFIDPLLNQPVNKSQVVDAFRHREAGTPWNMIADNHADGCNCNRVCLIKNIGILQNSIFFFIV